MTLDPGYVPLERTLAAYEARAAADPGVRHVGLALLRDHDCCMRLDLRLLPAGSDPEVTFRYVERMVKFALWACGGHTLLVSGAADITSMLTRAYAPGGARAFDAQMMTRTYGQSFAVRQAALDELPPARDRAERIGGHTNGCRIGFDLGASDYKVAAVRDGNVVFSTELHWDPKPQRDPAYHEQKLREGLRLAAAHLPRVDAIGGSSAGILVDNQPRIASLFRGVPDPLWESRVAPIFRNLADEWNAPVVVLNDGDVTALSTGQPATLGIAMGSSEAAGYVDRAGHVTGRLNELAFAPIDAAPGAAAEEWSGDRGVGALYFSQQAVAHLAPAAGFIFEAGQPLPERLRAVQAAATDGHPHALQVFATIGVCLAEALPLYARFYDFDHVLLLGRVLSGPGGDRLLSTAREHLRRTAPAVADRVELQVPDERMRRMGQAVVAAGLPILPEQRGAT